MLLTQQHVSDKILIAILLGQLFFIPFSIFFIDKAHSNEVIPNYLSIPNICNIIVRNINMKGYFNYAESGFYFVFIFLLVFTLMRWRNLPGRLLWRRNLPIKLLYVDLLCVAVILPWSEGRSIIVCRYIALKFRFI